MMTQGSQASENQAKSDIAIRSRKHIDITGVKEVLSFDEGSVSMITSLGEMTVEGVGLKVGTLDTEKGIVSVDGKISAVIYYDESIETGKKKLFGKAFGR